MTTSRKSPPKKSRASSKHPRPSVRKRTTKKKHPGLVENINARKRAGKSRPKSRSTVSKKAYAAMESGWKKKPRTAKKRAKK